MRSNGRAVGIGTTLLAGTILFAVVVNGHYPLRDWLAWRYLAYWMAMLFWSAANASFGYRTMGLLFPRGMRTLERLTFGFAIGVLAFALAIFFIGLLHGLNRVTFFALPMVFLAIGGRRLLSDLTAWASPMRVRRLRSIDARFLPVLGLGIAGLALLYFQLLSPETFSYDARWYHIPLAQRFALSGAIARFDEGLWFGAYPMLTSYLDTWAFLAPTTLLFDKLELCAHIELVLFAATLAQIPVLVRRLVPGSQVGLTWTAMFLFPQLYLYDSNLSAGADHVAAFFAIPIALAFWRSWHDFSARNLFVFSLCIGGAVLTKYTALPIVVPPALALLLRGLWLSVPRQAPSNAWQALGVLALTPVVVTAPHWLKNWIWYGDPIFPMLRHYLTVRPWNPDAEVAIHALESIVQHAPRNLEGVRQALVATLSFSFVVHDWYVLHHDVPVFGSLFTLTLPCLLFVKGARRIWWIYAGSMCAVFLWYLLILQERYLQAILPWMAAGTAACIIRIWKAGRAARFGLVPLVALQLVWGGDVPFFRTHNEIFDSPVRVVAQFLASGFERVPNRFDVFEPMTTIGKTMPPRAVALAHDFNRTLGIDRQCILDACQTRIGYARLRTASAIHRELALLGVTHLIWPGEIPKVESLASELSFLNYVIGYSVDQRTIGGYTVARVPPEPPGDEGTEPVVALFGCGSPYRTGRYRLSQLTRPALETGPAPEPEAELDDGPASLDSAQMVVVDASCHPDLPLGPSFLFGSRQGSSDLYVRRRSPSTK